MLDILQGTPLWVYAVYAWICYYGIKACVGGRESRRSLLILPVVLVAWSLMSLAPSILSSSTWVGGAVVGSLLGMLLFNADGARLDVNGETLVLAGTWKTLLVSQLFFAVKYYFGYQQAVHPLFLSTPEMLAVVGGVSGFTVGLFCGRAVRLQRALNALRRDKGIVLP
ncbi:hypothetical protein EXW72_19615 [Pseudomonas sp. BCA14]|uniref:DUF6622 family protein n=1 Tax=unclassified Pseudomonas TaxID=196821 RepID=UPI00106E0DFC|nr:MULTISPECIES: DUF6622 family protein [unclassified Pseudomonas]TFF05829.1 hypothetical protein EXW70_18375 [Pseudomonas sp. JMN1]TFF08082.1 hypothetical protein EXW71_18975 [Pseudomonas sp. BCA17]TFF24003.1 hypothetical protein EXW72_19615 [Pseudomonas sp. BCA14]TFF28254.1 hypothetical protein EXW73_12615 [Pseudomonas sp. BCA13]